MGVERGGAEEGEGVGERVGAHASRGLLYNTSRLLSQRTEVGIGDF